MRHVIVESTGYGNFLDPGPYLELLPSLSGALPPGAHAFATEPGHYAFNSGRCVKDLKPDNLSRGEDWLELGFRHNCWKHEEDLTIRYTGVSSMEFEPSDRNEWTSYTFVTLDEILPHEQGCSHEIGLRSGSPTVVSRDLIATWTPADCPDKPSNR